MRVNIASSILLGATTILAGCSDSTGTAAGRPVSVSFASLATPGTVPSRSPSSLGVSRSVTATSGSNTLVINRAQVVVARMELEQMEGTCSSTAAAGDEEGEDGHCEEMTIAPSIVDLPVDATIATPLQVVVPAGTYRALEAKIRPVRADSDHGKGSSAFLAAHPEFAGVTVRVEGTYNGKAFTYTGAPRAEFETVFNPPIVVDTKPANVTVNVDLGSWFRDGAGGIIDPASTSATDMERIASNIRRSFRAFHDDDRTGRDDHH